MEHVRRLQRTVDTLEGRVAELEERGEAPTAVATGDDPRVDANALGHFAADSETSRKAALANYPRSGSQRWRILQHIAGTVKGATREQIAEALRLSGDTVRPRVLELLEGGWLRVTDRTERTRLGEEAEVVDVTAKGVLEVTRREGKTLVGREADLWA